MSGAFTILPPPAKSSVDPNDYRLGRLANGMTCLLISNPSSISGNKRAPAWHHRTASCMGEDECVPCVGDFTSPAFNCTGAPDSAHPCPTSMFSHRKLPKGLIQSHNDFSILDHSFTEINKLREAQNIGKDSCKDFSTFNQTTTPKAALCLTINVGASNDPKDHNGMAHFCEHMVHYGSTDYPGEGDYFKLVKDKGGIANAFTQSMTTTYHFLIEEDYLEEGVSTFAGMMRNPKFNKDCIGREVHAVDNEFTLKEYLDFLAWIQILDSTAKNGHPLNKFSCGNLDTLLHSKGLDKLQETLKAFHKEYYVGSAMTLAIMSSDTLDELQGIVVDKLSCIRAGEKSLRKDMIIPENFANPFDTNNFKKIYVVKSRQANEKLFLSWSLSPDFWKNTTNKPMEFIEMLMGDEWDKGLAHVLRQKGFIIDISACCPTFEVWRNEYVSVFSIFLTLTKGSAEKYQEIIETVYSFINRLLAIPSKDMEDLWNEVIEASNTYFNYSGAGQPHDLTVQASRMLQIVQGTDIFTVNSGKNTSFDKAKINEVLEMMQNPKNMNIMLMASDDSLKDIERDQVERFTKARYSCFDVKANVLQRWRNATPLEFKIPKNNSFMTLISNPKIISLPPIEKYKVVENNKFLLIHKGHIGHPVHKAVCCVRFFNSVVKRIRIKNLELHLLTECLKLHVLQKKSEIERAGMHFAIKCEKDVLELRFEGYSETLKLAVEEILLDLFGDGRKGNKVLFTENQFKSVKDFTINNLTDSLGSGMKLLGNIFEELFIMERSTSFSDLEIVKKIRYKDVCLFFQLLKNSSYAIVEVEGNVSEYDCKSIQAVFNKLDFFPKVGKWWLASSLNKPLTCHLPVNQRCVRVKSDHRSEKNAYVMNLYGFRKDQDAPAIIELLVKMMSAPSFLILRTEQQLGYIVHVQSTENFLRSPGLFVLIGFPASKFKASLIDKRIDGFFVLFWRRVLSQMTECEFREQKQLWKIPADLTLDEIKEWYKNTFLEQIQLGKPSPKEHEWGLWNNNISKIYKVSLQAMGCDDEECSCAESSNAEWTVKTGPIRYAGDGTGEGRGDGCSNYYIDDPSAYRDKNYY